MPLVTDYFEIIPFIDDMEYKVYCFRYPTGEIFYIGCTKNKIINRCSGHLVDTFISISRRNIIDNIIESGNKIKVEVLYSFDTKIEAAAAEKLLINFCSEKLRIDLINVMCKLPEGAFLSTSSSHKKY